MFVLRIVHDLDFGSKSYSADKNKPEALAFMVFAATRKVNNIDANNRMISLSDRCCLKLAVSPFALNLHVDRQSDVDHFESATHWHLNQAVVGALPLAVSVHHAVLCHRISVYQAEFENSSLAAGLHAGADDGGISASDLAAEPR